MINELLELVTGEDGFVVTLRCDNKFDEMKYSEIKNMLYILVSNWKKECQIPKKAMLAIIELIECLIGGDRFLSEADSTRLEDASIEIKDLINELYETL